MPTMTMITGDTKVAKVMVRAMMTTATRVENLKVVIRPRADIRATITMITITSMITRATREGGHQPDLRAAIKELPPRARMSTKEAMVAREDSKATAVDSRV